MYRIFLAYFSSSPPSSCLGFGAALLDLPLDTIHGEAASIKKPVPVSTKPHASLELLYISEKCIIILLMSHVILGSMSVAAKPHLN